MRSITKISKESKELPSVLVIGQAFNQNSGGGVTQSNLFHSFIRGKVFSLPFGQSEYDLNLCQEVYIMGYKNKIPKIFWPFVRKKLEAKVIKVDDCRQNMPGSQSTYNRSISVVRRLILNIVSILGFDHFFYNYKLDNDIKQWLDKNNPDLIYAQFSTYATMKFVIKIQEYLQKPLAIHIMDDWITGNPSCNASNSFSEYSMLKWYWKRKYNTVFRNILAKSTVRIAISETMADEYKQRYGYNFDWAHNYIVPEEWEDINNNPEECLDEFVIGYFGTINIKNKDSMISMLEAIKRLNNNSIKFRIFSNDGSLLNKYDDKYDFMQLHKPVKAELYKQELRKCSLLFLPLGFNKKSLLYVKLSIPTKLSEYMISRVPILVYADKETALFNFCNLNKCAHLISENNIELLSGGISKIINDEKYCKKIVGNAYKVSTEKLSRSNMLNQFNRSLANTVSLAAEIRDRT